MEKVRRIRYKGTHPRRFEEKYKELDPQRYGGDVEKVLARGQTPAGTHRPICVAEILQALDPKPGETGLDATLGYGGHALEILKRITPDGRLFAIDVDPIEMPRTESRLRALGYAEDVLIIKRTNFTAMAQFLPQTDGGFDFILADLGVSSMQIDNPSRGFTFKADGPLDLRLNPARGVPASAFIKAQSEKAIAEMLTENADEPNAAIIARIIFQRKDAIATTRQLAEAVGDSLAPNTPKDEIKKTAQRVFQALRIAVNDEFNVLDLFLNNLPACLKPGGRAAILTFHSGEDRRVKKSFQAGFRGGVYSSVAPDPIRPSAQERHDNPRSSSAKLRWAIKK